MKAILRIDGADHEIGEIERLYTGRKYDYKIKYNNKTYGIQFDRRSDVGRFDTWCSAYLFSGKTHLCCSIFITKSK